LARKQNRRLKDFVLLEATTYIRMSFVTVKFNTIIEVSDTKGEIKHLQEHLDDYATSLLKGRETLILLEIKK